MPKAIQKNEYRTIEQIKEHYEIEKRLADRLRHATKPERRQLYSFVYDELYKLVPHHPNLTQKIDLKARAETISKQIILLEHFLRPDITFLEVGPGDCSLSFEVAKKVKKAYGVDVCSEITKCSQYPENFELIISDGSSISVPDNSIDVIFSHQVMEHLHPDDVAEQLQNIYRALRRGGIYMCITPNRLTGPHDVSGFFDEVATGFHLKEYTNTEIEGLLKDTGFSDIKKFIFLKGIYIVIPLYLIKWLERIVSGSRFPFRTKLLNTTPIYIILGINMVATK